jgi:uroporphyrinogen III methyltransferase / synthase
MELGDLQPLTGQTIAVTRMPDQADSLSRFLRAAGAEVIEAPTIELGPIEDYTRVDEALRHLDRYRWLILTSANGVDALFARMEALDLKTSHLAPVRIAAIGSATAGRLTDRRIRVDLVPPEAVGESMAEALIGQGVRDERILLLVADIARPQLAEALRAAGALCDSLPVYRTKCPTALSDEFLRRFDHGEVEWITLTSPSAFHNLVALLGPGRGQRLRSVRLASIGPVTTQAIREAGHAIAAEADPHDVDGLVAAIMSATTRD